MKETFQHVNLKNEAIMTQCQQNYSSDDVIPDQKFGTRFMFIEIDYLRCGEGL